jgi:hypothetical protein
LKRARALVGLFKHSPLLTEKLKEVIDEFNSKAYEAFLLVCEDHEEEDMAEFSSINSLKQDCYTRWNAAYFMLLSILEALEAIIDVLTRTAYKQKYESMILNDYEIGILFPV